MQNEEVKAPIYRVGNAVFAIKTGQSRLCHDRAIQGRNGVLPRAAAKQGKDHRVLFGVTAACRVRQRPFLFKSEMELAGLRSKSCPRGYRLALALAGALLLAACGITQETLQRGYVLPEGALEQVPVGA